VDASVVRFAEAARVLARAAHRAEVLVPGFRSPPRVVGVDRSVRRRGDGVSTVSVRVRGRPWAAVLADMVDGVVYANVLDGVEANRLRATLWGALDSAQMLTDLAEPSAIQHDVRQPLGSGAKPRDIDAA
jgi:hypothetical protein